MLNIKVDGVQELIDSLDDLSRRELPFAVAKALTKTAQDVQAQVLADLPGKFTLRTGWSSPRTPFGFKIEKATKQSWTAKVYTKAPWMMLQEAGGIKTAPGKRLAIPFVFRSSLKPGIVFGAKRTKRDLIQSKDKPRNLGPGTFELKSKSGNVMLAQRTGKGKRSVLRILYALEPQANVKRRLFFGETAQAVVDTKWRGNMADALEYAIRTSRLK